VWAGLGYRDDIRSAAVEISRNFYGTLRVQSTGADGQPNTTWRLMHGVIIHGEQYRNEERRREATTYYAPTSGIGRAITTLRDAAPGQAQRVGLIGLGVGTLATAGIGYLWFQEPATALKVASAGLIIAEATTVSPRGHGYPNTPGIYTDEQVAGWKKVTSAVHAKGGRIFLQLWHVGRISHPDYQPNGELPVAPSAIKPKGQRWTGKEMADYVVPRALHIEEIPGIVAEYVRGARRAKEAGFDGVEIHNANGYLLDQFLRSGTNTREDGYGNSLAARARHPAQHRPEQETRHRTVRLSNGRPLSERADGERTDRRGAR
jgi:hypothetical protein